MTTNPTSNPIISGEAGRGGENALGVTQIHWDFESCVLRNVGKDDGNALGSMVNRHCPRILSVVLHRRVHA